MRIGELYRQKKPVISLEIFPPKRENGLDTIYKTIEELKSVHPDFISVTYSAGGSGGNDITIDIASAIKNRYGIESLAHLTCVRSGRAEIDRFVGRLKESGVENIMALRGDIPAGVSEEELAGSDYLYAKDLISYIGSRYGGFCIGAAAYPEGHVNCDSFDDSLLHLKQKAEAGAEFFITQLFFDNSVFYHFYEKLRALGVAVPVSAGIMPILSRSQIEKMIFMCGVSLPSRIIRMLHKYENDPEGLKEAGIEYSSEQINDLIAHGVDGIHIYTMNRPEIAVRNIANLAYGR